MCIPTNHPFLKPFSIVKKAITRSRSPIRQSTDIASNDLVRLSSDPPILITPSLTIRAAHMATPVTGEVPGEGVVGRSQQVFPISADFMTSRLSTSPPIAHVLDMGLVSVGTDMTVALDRDEGPVEGAANFLLHPSPILTDLLSSDLPMSLNIHSALNAEVIPTNHGGFSTNLQAEVINIISAQNVNTASISGTMNQGVDPNIQITLKMIMGEQLVEKIYKWLSPPKESLNYNAANAILESQPDTCQWFLNGNAFHGWLNQPGFLWIKGKSGSGKTILSSAIIYKVLQTFNSATAYFFFDGRDSQKDFQLHHKLIRSLIWQFSLKCEGGVPKVLVNLYTHCGNGHQEPTLGDLQNTLQKILGGFSTTFIILDALDECIEREKLLNWIHTFILGKDINLGLHMIVTSRPEQEIEDKLKFYHHLDLVEESENHDLVAYLDYWLQNDSDLQKWKSDTQEQIKLTLMEKADGMFRWVALQLNELKKCRTKTDLRKQLADLPQGLDKTYDRILVGITEKDHGYAKVFLQWLSFAVCPLTLEELATTVAVDLCAENGPEFKSDNELQDIRDVLKICSSLIMKSEGFIKLSHFSVKEYLISQYVQNHAVKQVRDFSLSQELSDSVISQICLVYLLQFHTSEPLDKNVDVAFPLAKYAAQYWIIHAHSGSKDTSQSSLVFALMMKLLTDENAAFLNWVRLCDIDYYNYMDLQKQRVEIAKALYYASMAGLTEASYALLEMGVDVNAKGGNYGNALQAASNGGYEAIAKMLLEKGANVNAQGGYYGSALHAASNGGHEAIAKMLTEKGADVNEQGGNYGNALQAASNGGYWAIANLLIEKGADVNAQGGEHGNALLAASNGGYWAIANLLIEKGADVNAQGGEHGNALLAASHGGHEAVAKMLIEKGADVNKQGGYYENALLAASNGGHWAIANLLIEKGADVNAQGGEHGNALQAASNGGHWAIAKLLIEKGADVNALGGEYGNALQAALHEGYKAIVMLLIEKGADVNVQGGRYGNALQAASTRGHEAIAKMLIEKGANVNAQGGEYGSALQAASISGHEAIARLLIEKGADVNIQGGRYGNALQAASKRGHEAIVKMLIKKGANVNALGGECENALQAALHEGQKAIAKLLIEKGAKVSALGGEYGNALQVALDSVIFGNKNLRNSVLNAMHPSVHAKVASSSGLQSVPYRMLNILTQDGEGPGSTPDDHVMFKFPNQSLLPTFSERLFYKILSSTGKAWSLYLGIDPGCDLYLYDLPSHQVHRDSHTLFFSLKTQSDGGIALHGLYLGKWAGPKFCAHPTAYSYYFIPTESKEWFYICPDKTSRQAICETQVRLNGWDFQLGLKDLNANDLLQRWRVVPA